MSTLDVEYGIKRDVRNNPIVREVDHAARRQLWQWTVGSVALVGLLLFSALQHFEVLRHGYKIEEMRAVRQAEEEANRRLDEQTRTLLLLSSREESPRDWLEVGRAMQRLLLRATASGLAVSFLSQPIEVPEVRRRLRHDVGEAGHPQLLLRVGHGPAPRPTPRRPVDLVLRSFSADIAVEMDLEAVPAGVRTA